MNIKGGWFKEQVMLAGKEIEQWPVEFRKRHQNAVNKMLNEESPPYGDNISYGNY